MTLSVFAESNYEQQKEKMNSNNWDFDSSHFMAVWDFSSKKRDEKNLEHLIEKTIETLIKEGSAAGLLYYDPDSINLIKNISLAVANKKYIHLISTANEIDNSLNVCITVYDKEGRLKEKRVSKGNVHQLLRHINHYRANEKYIPLPFDITISIGKHDVFFTIYLKWDIWFEYVLCRPKWYEKYDANDIMGPDEELDYRKHAFNNEELAKINSSKLNDFLKRLKANFFIKREFEFEFCHTDNWCGYHKMTQENGIELLS